MNLGPLKFYYKYKDEVGGFYFYEILSSSNSEAIANPIIVKPKEGQTITDALKIAIQDGLKPLMIELEDILLESKDKIYWDNIDRECYCDSKYLTLFGHESQCRWKKPT